ncbi:MAG TPA: hypothetical protein VLX33_00885 [Nitrososphaerales archaeon]|nr:hypothetical protein [Nitrososphaerales archaeon]
MPKKKRESKKPFIAGFVVTIAVLVGGTIGLLYLNPPVPVNHIGSVPEYSPMWAKYVPASAVQFGFENYTGIRLYNSSYPTQYKFLLDISDVGVELKSTSINSVLSVTLDKPNESVAFAFVNQGAWNNFTDAFSKVGFAVTVIGDNSLYYVRNAEQGQFQYGWIALIPGDRGIAFALGDTDAKSALSICLEVTQSDSWISTLNVRQMLYLVNGTQHLAVGIQGFPGVLPEANNTLTAVDDTGSQVLIRRVLQFQNATMALQKYDLVRQDYLNSRQFGVYDSYVKATEYEAQNDLIGAVRLVE